MEPVLFFAIFSPYKPPPPTTPAEKRLCSSFLPEKIAIYIRFHPSAPFPDMLFGGKFVKKINFFISDMAFITHNDV